MSHIHLVGGEKGGVGKSTVARLLAQAFIDRGHAFTGLDGDQSVTLHAPLPPSGTVVARNAIDGVVDVESAQASRTATASEASR